MAERTHLKVSGGTRRDLGLDRGVQLSKSLAGAYAKYAELFRVLGVSESQERDAVAQVVAALRNWRPEVAEELEGIAEGSGLELAHIVALNARTEILALAPRGASECSTVTTEVAGRRRGVQTWDWHIELDSFWHTHEVDGPGYRYVGLTEQGIVSKIGVNEAGLALHFNILGHRADGPSGVPMHVLSSVVLTECATVREAVELIHAAPISSSSAFTMLDSREAVSVEMSPEGVFEIPEIGSSVQRTNHFQTSALLESQKTEIYEPDSSERLELLRERLSQGIPDQAEELVELLVSGDGEPPLTCVPDMSKRFGDRWATLATIVTDPAARSLEILDGTPVDRATRPWRVLRA